MTVSWFRTGIKVTNLSEHNVYGSSAIPEAIFGDNIGLFYETMEHLAPGAWDLNLGLQELWDEIDGNTYDWYMPDGFYACIETNDKEVIPFTFLEEEYEVVQTINDRPRFHKGLGPNLIHSIDGMIVREMFRRCQFNPSVTARVANLIIDGKNGTEGRSSAIVQDLWDSYLESGFLSVRILDYLFEDTIGLVDPLVIAKLIHSMPDKSFQLVSVHDCFRCHPNYGNDLRLQYNIIMADLNDSTIMPYMARQLCGSKISARKVGKIPREVILNGNYLLA